MLSISCAPVVLCRPVSCVQILPSDNFNVCLVIHDAVFLENDQVAKLWSCLKPEERCLGKLTYQSSVSHAGLTVLLAAAVYTRAPHFPLVIVWNCACLASSPRSQTVATPGYCTRSICMKLYGKSSAQTYTSATYDGDKLVQEMHITVRNLHCHRSKRRSQFREVQ